MNRRNLNFFRILPTVIVLIFTAFAGYSADLPQFTIMTEDWSPYNFQKDGAVQGISTDILLLMLEKVGSKQTRKDIELLPWARAYNDIQKKPNTILFTVTRTDEREKMFKWVGPIFEVDFSVYALKSKKFKINSGADLKKYKIGTLRGDVVEDLVIKKSGMKVSDFDQVASSVQNTKKLAAGRVDLIPMSKDTMLNTCKEAGINFNDVEPVFVLEKSSMYYAFHKDTPDSLIAVFQKAFDGLKKEGKVKATFQKYGK